MTAMKTNLPDEVAALHDEQLEVFKQNLTDIVSNPVEFDSGLIQEAIDQLVECGEMRLHWMAQRGTLALDPDEEPKDGLALIAWVTLLDDGTRVAAFGLCPLEQSADPASAVGEVVRAILGSLDDREAASGPIPGRPRFKA